MVYDPEQHHRRSIRLRGRDYSLKGIYYVTICTENHRHVFGDVIDGKMILSETGMIIETAWKELPSHYPCIELDEYVVMPHHIHGLIKINPASETGDPHGCVSLAGIVRGFKARATRAIGSRHNVLGCQLWQRNYYERIIRDEADLCRVRLYIKGNPPNWGNDEKEYAGYDP